PYHSITLLTGLSSLSLIAAFDDTFEAPNCFQLTDNKCPNSNISFWIYTKDNRNGTRVVVTNLSLFIPQRPLKVLIHGFNGNRDYTPNDQLRSLFLDRDYNVVSLDYANLAKEPCYYEAVLNAPSVGRCLGRMLRTLNFHRIVQSEDIHLIGFGLGAHVASFASNFLKEPVNHITALDPAKPFFLVSDLAKKLDPSDAKFVDVIHTDVMMLGLLDPVGHVDFYVNMGLSQPNCGAKNKMETHACYHNRSAIYYAESMSSPTGFYGYHCTSFKDFVSGACSLKDNVQLMGLDVSPNTRGRYFLDTNDAPPYAMGRNSNKLNRQVMGRTYVNDEIMKKMFGI
ncbi:hypothetical protein KR074_006659, partial [Drosophila pseudoananassae]